MKSRGEEGEEEELKQRVKVKMKKGEVKHRYIYIRRASRLTNGSCLGERIFEAGLHICLLLSALLSVALPSYRDIPLSSAGRSVENQAYQQARSRSSLASDFFFPSCLPFKLSLPLCLYFSPFFFLTFFLVIPISLCFIW